MLAGTTNEISAQLGDALRVLIWAIGVLISVALFTVGYQLLAAVDLKIWNVITGGVLSATLWQVLQLVAGPFVSQRVESAGAPYGTFAVVLAALAWIHVQALALMLSAEINVVLSRRLLSRALLTPFTDTVELTDADRRVYSAHATAATVKGFERVTTDLDGH